MGSSVSVGVKLVLQSVLELGFAVQAVAAFPFGNGCCTAREATACVSRENVVGIFGGEGRGEEKEKEKEKKKEKEKERGETANGPPSTGCSPRPSLDTSPPYPPLPDKSW